MRRRVVKKSQDLHPLSSRTSGPPSAFSRSSRSLVQSTNARSGGESISESMKPNWVSSSTLASSPYERQICWLRLICSVATTMKFLPSLSSCLVVCAGFRPSVLNMSTTGTRPADAGASTPAAEVPKPNVRLVTAVTCHETGSNPSAQQCRKGAVPWQFKLAACTAHASSSALGALPGSSSASQLAARVSGWTAGWPSP